LRNVVLGVSLGIKPVLINLGSVTKEELAMLNRRCISLERRSGKEMRLSLSSMKISLHLTKTIGCQGDHEND
jgi:hypothetical protein